MGTEQFMDVFKSMASHGVHLKVLKKFSDVILRLLFSIYKNIYQVKGVPHNQTEDDIALIFKEYKREDPGLCQQVTFSVVLGKISEYIFLGFLSKHVK